MQDAASADPELARDLRDEEISGTIRGYLNKITPEKFDTLSEQLIQWAEENIENSRQLMNVVSLLFDESIQEPKYGSMYAGLCKKLHESSEASRKLIFVQNGQKVAFRRNLL